MLSAWHKHPPLHRLFSMFVGYGQGEASQSKSNSFQITPGMMEAFGGKTRQFCRQSQLDPRVRKKVEPFQATPAYQEFMKNWRSKVDPRTKRG